MPAISLEELDAVALLDRIDRKYVIPFENLNLIIPELEKSYKVLDIDGNRIFTYKNNYFDTPDFQFYYNHHNGYVHRIKVRSRKYVETNSSFFEIKRKEKVDRTFKLREIVPDLVETVSPSAIQTVRDSTRKPVTELQLTLRNNFNRITFVKFDFSERITLDFNLEFEDDENKKFIQDFFVLEIKQSKSNGRSSITEILKKHNIREQGFSKYVYGMISLKKNIRKNNFLPLLRTLNKPKTWRPL
jgi:hypothetical protein